MAPRFSERFSLSSLATEIAYINRLISRASDRKSEYFGGLLKYFANLILQQRQVFGQHARGDTTRQYLQQRTQELQHQTTIAKLDVMDRKLDAILVQSYELHEYTIPRFFVVLPESLERWDSKSLAIGKYRLYFLCECDAHSSDHYKGSPTGGTATASFSSRRRVHLANHPGYSFSRPTEFLQLYGPYALGMLKILRCCLRASTIVPPAAGLANEAIQDTMQGIESIANNTMENIVSNSISFFKQKLKDEGIIKKLSTTPSGPDGSNQHNGDDDDEDDALQNVVALEGADLRRLRTFLRYSDTDRTLGNLYRTTTREGHVKWVCLRHYRTSYQETKMANFLSIVRVNKGTYDPHLRKVTVSLASSTAAKNFFETLANQAPAVDELEVVLDWSFRSSDLETLVKSINQSNVRILNLDLKDFVEKRSKFRSIMLPGKGKYHPLLELLWNKNLQGLSLSGAGGFGLRTSDFPMGQHFSSLRSLHFLNVFKGSEQLRLMKILSYCPNLTDLRMGDYIYWSKVRKELVSVIGSMTNLQTLHLYGLRGESGEPVSGILNAFANKGLLKELVCYSGRANELELGNVIRKLSRTLEVLIVDQMTSPYLDLVPTLTTSTTTGSGQATESTEFQPNFRSAGPLCAPYSRLTHLDLKAHLTPPSLDYLAKALKDLNLVHLGLTATTKALLSHVNFSTLKSLSLLNFEEPDMQPLLGFILTSSNQCQFDTLSLLGCTFTNPRTFAPLLGPLTLKRLQMSVLPSAQLKGVLGTLNLSRLEALVLVHCQYDWAAEEILAVKRKEFTPELTLHLSISDEYQVEGIHRAETRGHTDTQVRLAGRRVRLYSGTHLLLMDKPLMGVF
ncbi:hypothetical protein BGX33_008196 [Mortierella sp. NVP41]|nr:hypothetical protein BGX33_008196 [Mortierella sp. NVP41]